MQHSAASPVFSRQSAFFLLTLCLLSTGCASKYGPQLTQVNYYPQCYRPVAELRQDESSVNTSTGVGAAGGALLGALIGGLATGKWEGAAVGAVAGAAGGAVAGHAYGTSQQRSQDREKLAAYLRQIDGETAGMNRASAAAKVATQCYDRQFKQAATALKAGRITRQDFTDRYTEIRSGLEETSRILNVTASAMAEKDQEYQRVLAASQQQDVTPAAHPSAAKPGRVRRTASKPQARPEQNAIASKTTQWKQSQQELEATRQDVNERMQGYSRTVDELLG